jgi:hypothetical protein
MANQTLQSANFTINYDPAALPKSTTRANALFAVIENEFATLCGWFGVTGGFGAGNRVVVNFVLSLSKGGANNNGYHSDGSTTINLISRETDPSDANANAIVKMSFVAEFVEILMSYRNTQGPETWNAGYSHGEGLSLMCAQLRFPAGYRAAYGSFVNNWLQLPDRDAVNHDWITAPNKTDKDAESYGCSLLFLFYLKSQLHHSVEDIIQKGGSTLEITYQNLTGQSGAITAFRSLLDPYFPVGNTPTLTTDNPFPLLKGGQREVIVDCQTDALFKPFMLRSGDVEISPGILCAKKLYHYTIDSTPQLLTCVATTKGFGQPVYRWRINGVDISASGAVSPIAIVTIDDPSPTKLSSTKSEAVSIQCTLTPATFSSTLAMTFGATVGHIDLVIEAFASEKFASTDETGSTDWVTVDNESLVWEDQYYNDRNACGAKWREFVNSHVRYDPFFNILKTLPDPPEQYAQVIRQLEQLSVAINRLRARAPEDARTMEMAIERSTGLNATALHVLGKLAGLAGHREETRRTLE